MKISNIIYMFFYIYQNPRLNFDRYRNNQNIEEYGYVQDNGGAYHLCFHINDSGEKHFVRDIIKFISTKTKFSSECFKLNDNNEEHLYNILSSLIMIFYIDTHSFHNKTVFDNKALALYQLSDTCNSNLNNRIRQSYIFYLLYNSHLYYESISSIKLQNGVLCFKLGRNNLIPFLKIISSMELKRKDDKKMKLLSSIKSFYIDLIDFLEDGLKLENVFFNSLIDDRYLKFCHYKNFIYHSESDVYKRVRVDKIFNLLPLVLQEGKLTENKFVSYMILFNYMNLIFEKTSGKLQKYLNENECSHLFMQELVNYFDYSFGFYSKRKRINIKKYIKTLTIDQ